MWYSLIGTGLNVLAFRSSPLSFFLYFVYIFSNSTCKVEVWATRNFVMMAQKQLLQGSIFFIGTKSFSSERDFFFFFLSLKYVLSLWSISWSDELSWIQWSRNGDWQEQPISGAKIRCQLANPITTKREKCEQTFLGQRLSIGGKNW